RLALAEMPPQTIRAELVSACRPSMPVTFGHAGLRFTVATDREGRAVAEIPAFAEEAAVEARFADGTELRGEVQVPGLERVARAALVWQGEADLKLHAFEFGAAEEAPGHVWRGAARSYREARRHGGGYLVLLGDPALDGFRSEVYTMLVGRSVPQGIVRLELEVAARGDACAAPIDFAAILTDAVRQGEQRDVRLAIDDCAGEAVSRMYRGGLRDLAIAAR
ncbi:MAG TPA: hypothetical protein VFR34_05460, partial [Paracoccaceae bacterium]|nr:hypothetical protein [Paracoccaceae bacterium]